MGRDIIKLSFFYIKESTIDENEYKDTEEDLILETILNLEEHSKKISDVDMIKKNLETIEYLKKIMFQ